MTDPITVATSSVDESITNQVLGSLLQQLIETAHKDNNLNITGLNLKPTRGGKYGIVIFDHATSSQNTSLILWQLRDLERWRVKPRLEATKLFVLNPIILLLEFFYKFIHLTPKV